MLSVAVKTVECHYAECRVTLIMLVTEVIYLPMGIHIGKAFYCEKSQLQL
jgi:hypothetical protein